MAESTETTVCSTKVEIPFYLTDCLAAGCAQAVAAGVGKARACEEHGPKVAEVLLAARAPSAVSAGGDEREDDVVAFGDPLPVLPGLGDDAGALMAAGHRVLADRDVAGREVIVGTTQPGGDEPDLQFIGPGVVELKIDDLTLPGCAAARFETARIGDPHDPRTEIGPLISERQRERVENYVSLACEAGARVVVGGSRSGQPTGWCVEPTLLTDVDNSMRVAREEIFGPVLCVLAYDSEDDAVAIANGSEYGLSGAVYSTDPGRALHIARLLRTGGVDINGVPPGMAAPRGGFKKSGIGAR